MNKGILHTTVGHINNIFIFTPQSFAVIVFAVLVVNLILNVFAVIVMDLLKSQIAS